MMNDDKLREACERVIEIWIGAQLRPYGSHGVECYHKEDTILGEQMEVPIQTTNGTLLKPENITELASPWGMDLLLDAAGEKGVDWAMKKFMVTNYYCSIMIFKETTGDTLVFDAEHENRYAALILALDKASEVLNENSNNI